MTHSLAIPTRRGLKLAGLYDEPDGSTSCPLVILMHGNTGWKEEQHLATLAQGLSLSGIAALRFDAPGSGASEGTWADDYRVSNYVEAVLDVLDYSSAYLGIDRERIGLWSHSMGGLVAATAARLRPEFTALCFSQPSTGNSDISPEELRHWRDTGWRDRRTEQFGVIRLPIEFYDDRNRHNTLTAIKDIHVPGLFIAGTCDLLVSAESVRSIYLAAREPKTYLEFPAGHDYKNDIPMLKRLNAATIRFFADYLNR